MEALVIYLVQRLSSFAIRTSAITATTAVLRVARDRPNALKNHEQGEPLRI
jgi:hypothetical protein